MSKIRLSITGFSFTILTIFLVIIVACTSPTGPSGGNGAGPQINPIAAALEDFDESSPLPETKAQAIGAPLLFLVELLPSIFAYEFEEDADDFFDYIFDLDDPFEDGWNYTASRIQSSFSGFDQSAIAFNFNLSGEMELDDDPDFFTANANVQVNVDADYETIPNILEPDEVMHFLDAEGTLSVLFEDFFLTYEEIQVINDGFLDFLIEFDLSLEALVDEGEPVYIKVEGDVDINLTYALSISSSGDIEELPVGGKYVIEMSLPIHGIDLMIDDDTIDDIFENIEDLLLNSTFTILICNNAGEVIETFIIGFDEIEDLLEEFFEEIDD